MNIIDIYHFHALFFNQFYRLLKMLETKLTGASSFLLRFIWNYVFVLSVCPSVRLSVTQFVSATPLKLLNRISWNLVGSKDTICSCAYYQEILISWILWELCPFELRNFPKFTTEAACQRNSSETTEQNFMKLCR